MNIYLTAYLLNLLIKDISLFIQIMATLKLYYFLILLQYLIII